MKQVGTLFGRPVFENPEMVTHIASVLASAGYVYDLDVSRDETTGVITMKIKTDEPNATKHRTEQP